jgi:DNA-binding MarR family transcriptional regulator
MSTPTPGRKALVHELDEASQRCGNLTILFTNALASRVGLSATEFECLSLLGDGPLPAGRLAELCGLTTGAITGLVDRLEKVGYAERQADPHDRRRVLVALKNGEVLRQKASALYVPLGLAFNELADQYSVQDLSTILGYMHGVNAMMEAQITAMHKQG